MAAVPTIFYGILYPPEKGVKPYMVTLAGWTARSDVEIGGGPILPPDQVPPVEPPLEIWPGPGDPDYPGKPPVDPGLHPEHPIVIPPEVPPIEPPAAGGPVKKNAWNWNDGSNPQYPNTGWYYVYVPGEGQPGPKRK